MYPGRQVTVSAAVHYYFGMAAGADIRVHMDRLLREPDSLILPAGLYEIGKAPVGTTYEWYIVLTNVGSSPARNVRYVLEPASGVSGNLMGVQQKEIAVLQGNGARERIWVLPWNSTSRRISLKLTWSDDEGSKEQYSEIEVDHDGRPFAMRITHEGRPAYVKPTTPKLPSTTPVTFICYSWGDKPQVSQLVERLKSDGVPIWFDEDYLQPGHDWKYEIQRAIRGSRFLIACLSQESTAKRGFVNAELKQALDVADEQPEGSTFIIPVRLDECTVPMRLQQWQWVDLFREEGYERLCKVLRVQP
jgi:hypothetical protein